jgi:hypothetical protein
MALKKKWVEAVIKEVGQDNGFLFIEDITAEGSAQRLVDGAIGTLEN